MANRRDDLLDAAIALLGGQGVHGVTHRAVDAAAGLPAGSTSNYFRTRDALLEAAVERFAARERANFEDIAIAIAPTTPAELARALAAYAQDSVGPNRTLTLARYAILVEAANRPALRAQLSTTGAQITAWHANWLRVIGSTDPERDTRIVANFVTGAVLHQLSYPNPAFDPTGHLTDLIESLVQAADRRLAQTEGAQRVEAS
jgi:DNA-binding transcriptional regulator YbjK